MFVSLDPTFFGIRLWSLRLMVMEASRFIAGHDRIQELVPRGCFDNALAYLMRSYN